MGRNVTVVGQEVAKKELKKHAATIHCSNSLSLLQRKITNALLFHAYKELMHKDEHEITVKQLCRLIGYHGNNHACIKDALRELISTVIEWNLIDDKTGAENWTASSILASVSLEGPLCYFAYSPRMKQLLHSPSIFGKIDLVIQSKFRSSYGLALYENCIRYRSLPQTKWFELELFKKLMGVQAGKYDLFRDFKRRVLDKAIDEVNTYSDLFITPEFIREGRKIAKIRFILKERAKRTRLGTVSTKKPKKQTDAFIAKLMTEFHLASAQIEQLLQAYERPFLEEKVTLLEQSKAFQEGKIKNKAAYLLSAIKNNYQLPTLLVPEVNIQEELMDVTRVVEEIHKDYAIYREQVIKDAIACLSKETKKSFMKAFYDFASPTINIILQLQRTKYTRETVIESPQIKALLRRYAARELDDLVLLSPEEFISQLEERKQDAWHTLKAHDPEHSLLRLQG